MLYHFCKQTGTKPASTPHLVYKKYRQQHKEKSKLGIFTETQVMSDQCRGLEANHFSFG